MQENEAFEAFLKNPSVTRVVCDYLLSYDNNTPCISLFDSLGECSFLNQEELESYRAQYLKGDTLFKYSIDEKWDIIKKKLELLQNDPLSYQVINFISSFQGFGSSSRTPRITLLIQAIRCQQETIIDILLALHADVNGVKCGPSALMVAISNMLIKDGVINTGDYDLGINTIGIHTI
ncbi:hypothetical protein H0X06_05250 [Candidatus Dependentiae bacterium]|nr:hypothetical protein [Candidatus Dependentiae bacterium]